MVRMQTNGTRSHMLRAQRRKRVAQWVSRACESTRTGPAAAIGDEGGASSQSGADARLMPFCWRNAAAHKLDFFDLGQGTSRDDPAKGNKAGCVCVAGANSRCLRWPRCVEVETSPRPGSWPSHRLKTVKRTVRVAGVSRESSRIISRSIRFQNWFPCRRLACRLERSTNVVLPQPFGPAT